MQGLDVPGTGSRARVGQPCKGQACKGWTAVPALSMQGLDVQGLISYACPRHARANGARKRLSVQWLGGHARAAGCKR